MGSNPVFIVGPSRSGTTLLQEVMNRHSQFHISAETHWFDDERCQRHHAIETDDARKAVQDWFLSLSHKAFGYQGCPEQGWLQREDLEREAQATATDLPRDAYFVAACKLNSARQGKPRWGEKTPRHVFRIDEILDAQPDAKIVCCIRNAPAMIASYQQWGLRNGHDISEESQSTATAEEKQRTRASYHPAIVAMLWRGAILKSLKALEQYGEQRVKLVWYEELVADAQGTISDLLDWLDEPFEPETLNVPMINSSFDHFKREAGFNSQPLNRWQKTLSPGDLAVIQLICGGALKRTGYAPVSQWHQLWRAVPLMLQLPSAVLRAARANRHRTGKLLPYLWRRLVAS